MEKCPECKRFTLYWDYVLNARRCGNTECNYCEVELAPGGGIDPEVLNEMHRRREEN